VRRPALAVFLALPYYRGQMTDRSFPIGVRRRVARIRRHGASSGGDPGVAAAQPSGEDRVRLLYDRDARRLRKRAFRSNSAAASVKSKESVRTLTSVSSASRRGAERDRLFGCRAPGRVGKRPTRIKCDRLVGGRSQIAVAIHCEDVRCNQRAVSTTASFQQY
jgi:hypothetical protein